MQFKFTNVTLVYTNHMTTPGSFGGYSFSFIVNENEIYEKALQAIEKNKKMVWPEDAKSLKQILKAMSAKHISDLDEDVASQKEIISHMNDNDVLICVKSKTPIKATKKAAIPWYSTADILVDMYSTQWGGKKFVSRVAPDVISVKVRYYAEMPAQSREQGFESEEGGDGEEIPF